jgi:hypothetical protein
MMMMTKELTIPFDAEEVVEPQDEDIRLLQRLGR